MKRLLAASGAFLLMMLVVLGLRREEVIADSIAVILIAVSVLGFAGCTVWAGIRAVTVSRERR